MNDKGTFIAVLLETSSKAYAAGAVLRIREKDTDSAMQVEQWGFQNLVQDMQLRLQHLAVALACGRPEILTLDIEWLSASYLSRNVPIEFLRTCLHCLGEELKESLPEEGQQLVEEYLSHARSCLEIPSDAPKCLLDEQQPLGSLARRFLQAVLGGDRGKAVGMIMDAIEKGATVEDIHLQVIVAVQRELGRLWQVGEGQIADEHFGSRIVEDVLAQLRSSLPAMTESERCVVLASVSGNLHDIGPRIVADHFERSGWRTIFLGANMPIADLVQSVQRYAPDLVALSVGQSTNLRSAADSIAALRAAIPGLAILVGGGPLEVVDGLWRDLGADAFAANGAEAVAFGQSVVRAG